MSPEGLDKSCAAPNCVFCDIIRTNDPQKILFQDDVVAVFRDITPAAKHHYLIVTKHHIQSAKHLDPTQKDVVTHMVSVGKKILEEAEEGATFASPETRSGFHLPPFHSISHLHMHVINPVSELKFLARWMYRPDSWWFVTPEYVLSQLGCNEAQKGEL